MKTNIQKGEKMRLIDADAIKYEHHERIGMGIDYGVNENSYYDIAYKTQIDKMPTIELEYEELDFVQPHKKLSVSLHPEQKKGMWIDDGTELGCCCSKCGKTLDDYFDGALYEIYLKEMPNFCLNCGADMREGESNALN